MSSGVAAVNYVLSNNSALIAAVPATKIVSGPIALGTVVPAISVRHITGGELLTVSMAETRRMRWARIQVTAYAEDYPTKKAILELVRTALRGYRGSVNNVAVDSILPDVEGPDLDDPGEKLFEQSQDFIVKWTE